MGFQNLIYSLAFIKITFLVSSVTDPCQAGQVAQANGQFIVCEELGSASPNVNKT
jgi:hypothetical protein